MNATGSLTVSRRPKPPKNDQFMTVRVDRELYERLVALSRRNDRSVSSEIRRAVRKHVEEGA